MIKAIRGILKTVCLLTVFFMPVFLHAGDGFTIKKYSVSIAIGENGVLDINENILANFFEKKHGIYRFIPIKGYSIIQINGQEKMYHWKIALSNITVNKEMSNWIQDNKLYIRMGSPDITVFGDVEYDIHYTVYNALITKNKQYDQLCWNVIGTDWAVDMNLVEFEIIYPGNINIEKDIEYKISYGKKGSKTTAKWTSDTNKNKAVYIHQNGLKPHEGITVDIKIKKGCLNVQE